MMRTTSLHQAQAFSGRGEEEDQYSHLSRLSGPEQPTPWHRDWHTGHQTRVVSPSSLTAATQLQCSIRGLSWYSPDILVLDILGLDIAYEVGTLKSTMCPPPFLRDRTLYCSQIVSELAAHGLRMTHNWWFSGHVTQSRTSFFLYVCVISSLSATAGMTSSLSASLSVRVLSPLLTSMSSLTPRDWGRITCSDWPTNYATSTITGQWVQRIFRTLYPVSDMICSEHFQLHTVYLEHLVWISIVSLQTCCES